MFIKKKDIHKILAVFLFGHLFVWTLIPGISNENLPLDTIEALAWGTDIDWGYIKHPPLSAWFTEIFFQLFGNQDWAYYFLSQIFVIFSFFIIFKFSEDFFKNKIFSLMSVFLLEGIYFYNFTTPEFNVNICQLPFYTLTVYYFWKGINQKDNLSWLLFGFFAGLGVLSKYLFIYLLISLDLFIIYLIYIRKFQFRCLISLVSFVLVLLPHLIWLIDNDYTTISYALERTSAENVSFLESHLLFPFTFFAKQIGILIPFFILFFIMISKFKIKIKHKDIKLIFLFFVTVSPVLLTFLTSLVLGIKIRTMWMTPFYLFLGIFFIYIYQKRIMLIKINNFISVFLILFLFSPLSYLYISITQKDKRTDYPGKKVSEIVQKKWDANFKNKIGLVSGDEWYAGNLSYHLKSRPKWDNIAEDKKTTKLDNFTGGFVIILDDDKDNLKTLLKICTGLFFKVDSQGVCMIGEKK
jgi:hypothetical protein